MMAKVTAGPIRRMSLDDIETVVSIDQRSFSLPWSEHFYRSELNDNPAAYLYVIEEGESPRHVVGYLGFWFIVDEAHISTFAVDPGYRRASYGRRLLTHALSQAVGLGAEMVSLEVRASNQVAVTLYESFGFRVTGRKTGYYQDNGEEALFMILEDLEPWRKSEQEAR
jgi:ribosomal-protein-alanine N-acetyltransferase